MVSFFSSDASPFVAKSLVCSDLTAGCGRVIDVENDGIVSTAMKAAAVILVDIAVVIAATTTAVVTALLGRALLLLMMLVVMVAISIN